MAAALRTIWLLVPIGALVGLPLQLLPARPLAWLVTVAGLLCVAGVLGRSSMLVGAGCAAAVLAYALALWIVGPPADVSRAVAFGLALLLTLEGSHFAARLHGAAVARRVVWRQAWRWAGLAGASIGAVVLLDGLADLAAFSAPAWVYPTLAALGALAVVAGAAKLLAAWVD